MADTPIASPVPDVTRGNIAACITAAIFGLIAGQIAIAAGDDAWMLLILFALIGPIVPVRLASTKIRLAATALFAVVMVGTMMKDRLPQGPPVWSVVTPPHELVVLVAAALSVPLTIGAGWALSRLYEWWDVQRAMLQSTSSKGPLTAEEQQAMIYDAMNEICDGLRSDYPSVQFEWHRTLSGTDAPASIMFFVVSKEDCAKARDASLSDQLDLAVRVALGRNGYIRRTGDTVSIWILTRKEYDAFFHNPFRR